MALARRSLPREPVRSVIALDVTRGLQYGTSPNEISSASLQITKRPVSASYSGDDRLA